MNVSFRSTSRSLQRATKSLHSLSKARQIPRGANLRTFRETQSFQSNIRLSGATAAPRSFVRNYVTGQDQQQPPKPSNPPTTSASGPIGGPGAPRPPRDDKLKAWPFVLIFAIGAVTFAAVLDKKQERTKMPVVPAAKSDSDGLPRLRDDGPIFDPKDIKVIFVLGGPGVGKGTQCAKLVKDYGFVHLSAGDLLREEQSREGTDYGDLIKTYIREGKIVPMEVTIVLLENAMKRNIEQNKKTKFLIDGFPRQMDQALKFEEVVVPSQFTLFFDCDEDTMTKRLLERGKTSGRSDDNMESILKRFRTFKETSMPVVNYFESQKKVVKVDGGKNIDAVYKDVVSYIAGLEIESDDDSLKRTYAYGRIPDAFHQWCGPPGQEILVDSSRGYDHLTPRAHVWGSRSQEEDHNTRPEISFTSVDGSAHGRKQEGVFSLIIAGAYKEVRNSELEITFTIAGAYKEDRNSKPEITIPGVGGLDEANATKKVAQGSKIPFEPEDPHVGYLVKPKTLWSHRTFWPTLGETSGVEDPQAG
ncbi:hypothetical protein TWF191_001017 [Orbilia oligospora]|uniref:Uridylate kinase n=1 Tax=Orbilia oligospora TaxID=2813651 RepID=A0A7C8QEN0_ORBOL|nr:hypothetical protein TWF191_001017 [Orbilia oligospora]